MVTADSAPAPGAAAVCWNISAAVRAAEAARSALPPPVMVKASVGDTARGVAPMDSDVGSGQKAMGGGGGGGVGEGCGMVFFT